MRLAKGSGSWILVVLCGIILTGLGSVYPNNPFQKFTLILFLILMCIEGFFLIFFRDPERKIGEGIVAVADGVIREISEIDDEKLGMSVKISTFMNVNNVHVNRAPVEGVIKKMMYIPGGHIPAYKKESARNERMITFFETANGPMKIVQIAGCIARRIVAYAAEGDRLCKGQRMGIIRLGSRVDLIIPTKMMETVTVKKGDHVWAGTTQVCTMK